MNKCEAVIVEALIEYIRDNRELCAVIKELQEQVVFANSRTTAARKDLEGARQAQDKLEFALKSAVQERDEARYLLADARALLASFNTPAISRVQTNNPTSEDYP